MMGMDSQERWAQQAFFGAQIESPRSRRGGYDLNQAFSMPDAKTLPEVLAATDARGWLAEGLVRLYMVEEVARRYGGRFQHLEISSATVRGVRAKGSFNIRSGNDELVRIEGLVPFQASEDGKR